MRRNQNLSSFDRLAATMSTLYNSEKPFQHFRWASIPNYRAFSRLF